MKSYTIISEELMKQVKVRSLITKRTFNTIAEEVVGKWVIMAKLESGIVVFGTNEDRDEAIKEIEAQY